MFLLLNLYRSGYMKCLYAIVFLVIKKARIFLAGYLEHMLHMLIQLTQIEYLHMGSNFASRYTN